MPVCTRSDACPYFGARMATMPSTAEMFRAKYCRADWPHCARFRVLAALGSAAVPDDLNPNDQAMANKILRDADDQTRDPA